eukprot:5354710-Prymnesium_polylepis.2
MNKEALERCKFLLCPCRWGIPSCGVAQLPERRDGAQSHGARPPTARPVATSRHPNPIPTPRPANRTARARVTVPQRPCKLR